MRRLAVVLGLALLLVLPLSASSRKRAHGRSPHAEIEVVATVETAPRRTTHKNRREFEEFDVTILSAERASDGNAAGEAEPRIATSGRVHVVHDLTCGGSWVDARPGDHLEIKGEYVHPPRGKDLIHFTHPANAGGVCGSGGRPNGYIRPAPKAAATSQAETPATPPEADLFVTAVRPVLARRCVCHEKGGKMYERLPFDDPAVVSSHADGARRRLKGDDLAAVERWLATLPPAASPNL